MGTVSPYKNKRLIEHFMKDADIKGKHTKYALLMENMQVLTSRDIYNLKFRSDEEREAVKAMWPTDCPKLAHRSHLQKYMTREHANQFWCAGLSRL